SAASNQAVGRTGRLSPTGPAGRPGRPPVEGTASPRPGRPSVEPRSIGVEDRRRGTPGANDGGEAARRPRRAGRPAASPPEGAVTEELRPLRPPGASTRLDGVESDPSDGAVVRAADRLAVGRGGAGARPERRARHTAWPLRVRPRPGRRHGRAAAARPGRPDRLA